MDIDQVETFLAIAQTGSFTRAGSIVHRSQPAISRRLAMLEREVGARDAAGIKLTDVGRAFLPHAEGLLAAMRDGQAAIRTELAQPTGSVSLAVVGTFVDQHFAQLLWRFSKRDGQGRLKVLAAQSDVISRLVRCGEATLGIRYFEDDCADLINRHLGVDAMVVVAAPKYKPGPAGPLHWIGFPQRESKADFGRLLRKRLFTAGYGDAEIMEVDSLSGQKRLVEAGFGLALLPKSYISDELAARSLTIISMPAIETSVPVILLHRRGGYLSPAAQELITLLVREWGNQVLEGPRRRSTPSRRV
jgi:DNA-binding transcriptional LysR family regulator